MKFIHQLPFYCFVLFAGTACTSSAHESDDAMINSAKEVDKKFVEAYNKGDANAVADTYWNNPELVAFQPDAMELKGFSQLKDYFDLSFKSAKGATLEIPEANYRVAGDVVYTWGIWTLTLPDSVHTKINGRYTDIKSKKDGKWVYIVDHASVPLAPAPSK
jgi:ketosteroid isomerase-like protein